MKETLLKHIDILFTGALPPTVANGADAAFTVHRLAEASDRAAFLREHGHRIRGVAATGSHGPIGAALFDQLPALEIVSHFGVGYDNVDVAEAARRGIMVTNTPDVLTDEVADLTLGLLIATVRRIPRAEQHLRTGQWRSKPFPLSPTLRGRTVGILGLGRIGKAIAVRCEAFGLPVAYHGRREQAGVAYAYHASAVELARNVDVLIAVTPGGPETRHLVNAEVLEALGPDGVFVNVARGSVVDEDALLAALRDKTILAAGLDVFENEPNIRPEFLELENAVLLPHIASASVHTRNAMGQLVVDNLLSWFGGQGAKTPVPELAEVASSLAAKRS
jgi:lactate dehydrogenase-like 2-hydroxyacid dehydrogenase